MSQGVPERRSTSTPERWEPLSELEQVTQRMRRMLDQTFGGFTFAAPLIGEPDGWVPRVDIEEQDGAYVVEAELPGVKREDVNIELVRNELSITGEVKEQEREGTLRRHMRRTGAVRVPRDLAGPGGRREDRSQTRQRRPHRAGAEVRARGAPEDRDRVLGGVE